jgi:hypothetical protein
MKYGLPESYPVKEWMESWNSIREIVSWKVKSENSDCGITKMIRYDIISRKYKQYMHTWLKTKNGGNSNANLKRNERIKT